VFGRYRKHRPNMGFTSFPGLTAFTRLDRQTVLSSKRSTITTLGIGPMYVPR
jgi:hypothetical protein